MLRRSLGCQHSKLVFSKVSWYNIALKAVLPEKTCVQRAIQFQCSRTVATMAATALDDIQQDMATEIQQLPPLEPLLKTKIPADITTVKSKSSVSHFKRCCGHRTSKEGGQCTRLVKIDLEQAEDKVYCYSHLPKSQNKKHLPATSKEMALHKHPSNHAKRKERVKQPATRLKQMELQPLMGNVHNHDHSPKLRNEEHSPAIVEKEVLYTHHADAAKEKETTKQHDIIHDCWQLWIGDHIAPKRKSLIRQVMKDPISDRDKAGYIYGFLLEDGPRVSQVEHAYFKIGRAQNPHRRMYQVARSCNLIPKLVEVIPKFPEKPSAQDKQWIMPVNVDLDASQVDNDSNAMETKCPMSHRVERLIHLELASQYQRAGFKCDKCGSTHREWFRVDRRRHANGKLMTDQELWHSDIRPIVLKWIQFGVVATALKS
ncbi:uncharacterized protein ATC70_005280 [Mucor velutinosus]|uniref:Bacteriophage T5 Orf172 DNA-binding domain-containing protein n=1 Tax=Mucor velutinosus TaxID=708070 RepID=A0AAN7HQY6_9FUNG|nr:hypothetical protein ATC70_005280 [Mucor velutinosus]